MNRVRVELPLGLRVLAGTGREVMVLVAPPITPCRILTALEAAYPMLLGTIRDRQTGARRPFIRFFACEEDYSQHAADVLLPEAVAAGREPLLIVGAIAGG